jgi:hypothetical protein
MIKVMVKSKVLKIREGERNESNKAARLLVGLVPQLQLR